MSYYKSSFQPIASSSQLPVPTSSPILEDTRTVPADRASFNLGDEVEAIEVLRSGEAEGEGEGRKAGRVKVRGRINRELLLRLAASMCNFHPIGTCLQAQGEGSLYCELHSCQAINADGDRCRNGVKRPNHSRFCATSYHAETSREEYLEALLARRRAYDEMATLTREEEHLKQVLFFDSHFSISTPTDRSIILSPTSSQSFSSSSRSSNNNTKDRRINHSWSEDELRPSSSSFLFAKANPTEEKKVRLEDEKGWGAYGVDKWWIGNWRGQPVGEVEQSRWRAA
ncbi:hypothetical protein IAR55_001582 [Kwoniella newhampshirensis]|uniref:SCA7 domain-containing protein n=1 Tax=Kwoniella newhampshirensis TaxID=1651941 RepID=A0AAW0Z2J6_9TREE